jgi:hypothetical protein
VAKKNKGRSETKDKQGAKGETQRGGGRPFKDYGCPSKVRTTKMEVVLTNLEKTAKK